jgi:transmembrane sensor
VSSPGSRDGRYTKSQCAEAAAWFVVIRAENDPSSDVLQSWIRWMDQDTGNRVAFESVTEVWHDTPADTAALLPSAAELLADDYECDQPVEEWLAGQRPARPVADLTERRGAPRVPRWQRSPWFAVASLGILILSILTMTQYLNHHLSESDRFTTSRAEQIEIALADGSKVWLGPQSALQVEFSAHTRALRLTAGEAFFMVKKDHTRPFIVASASGDITAVGTAFDVRTLSDHVAVSVSEGVVTVAPRSSLMTPEPGTVRVASGQQVTFAAQEPVGSLTITKSPMPGERSRWREGILVYRDETLRNVVMDVARYSDKPLEFNGDANGELHYSGIVYRSAIDEWTAALPESFPVTITTDGNRKIIRAP